MAGKPGWKQTEDAKRRIAEANRGQKRSEATKSKISATLRKRWRLIEELEQQAQRAA